VRPVENLVCQTVCQQNQTGDQRDDPGSELDQLACAAPDKLPVSRTMMAADRSLMAWIRTALSMISFGFTI